MRPPIAWTVAGFDPSGGAGITADLLTFAAHGLYGCSAITAITVQSTIGVAAIEPTDSTLLAHTLAHLHADLPPAGVKIGMLGSRETMRSIANFLRGAGPEKGGRPMPVVLDPVLRSSSGYELYPVSGLEALRAELLPSVDFVTPNWKELSLLTGMTVTDLESAEQAARSLIAGFPKLHVLATGGDQPSPIDLLLTPGGRRFDLPGTHITSEATHGTGCAFSSALLAHLVLGADALSAAGAAKAYVAEAIRHAPGLGRGKGPLGLLWNGIGRTVQLSPKLS